MNHTSSPRPRLNPPMKVNIASAAAVIIAQWRNGKLIRTIETMSTINPAINTRVFISRPPPRISNACYIAISFYMQLLVH